MPCHKVARKSHNFQSENQKTCRDLMQDADLCVGKYKCDQCSSLREKLDCDVIVAKRCNAGLPSTSWCILFFHLSATTFPELISK